MKNFVFVLALAMLCFALSAQTTSVEASVSPYAGIAAWTPSGNFNQGITGGVRFVVNVTSDTDYGYHFSADIGHTSLHHEGRQRFMSGSIGIGMNNGIIYGDLRVTYLQSATVEDIAGLGGSVMCVYPKPILGFKPYVSVEGYAVSRGSFLTNMKVGVAYNLTQ